MVAYGLVTTTECDIGSKNSVTICQQENNKSQVFTKQHSVCTVNCMYDQRYKK